MSLLDALLLDPLRMNVWVAVRTDGVAGTGTQSDPYDGSTQAKFDAVMSALPTTPPIAVRLGPGTFKTNGYADGVSGGWQPRPAMKIVGSGIDVTVLQLAGGSANAHFYAIGHPVSTGSSPSVPNLVDYFEVCDLTIDCNLGTAFTGTSVACGAVRIFGNHARVRRLKLINWGTRDTSRPCFVVCLVTATDLAWVEDCGTEECIALSPAAANLGPVNVLHAGGTEAPPACAPGFGVAPYIRNCFVDAGQSPPSSTIEIRGLSMAWCKAGIIEGNQAHNLTYGTFQQLAGAQDLVIRNNWFKNVNKGILLGNTGAASSGGGSLSLSTTPPPPVATVTFTGNHGVCIGDSVLLNTSGAYNGLIVTVLATAAYSPTVFQFYTSNSATLDMVNSVQRVFGVSNATIEGNVVELALATSGSLIAIHADDSKGTSAPGPVDATYPGYYFGKMVVRDNKLRYLDGQFASNYVGYGMQIDNAGDLLIRNNVIESAPVSPPPMRNNRCGAVAYFNNLWPSGVLIQGTNGDTGNTYEELATIADFALVMSLFNKK
jgi:hypothetical protein